MVTYMVRMSLYCWEVVNVVKYALTASSSCDKLPANYGRCALNHPYLEISTVLQCCITKLPFYHEKVEEGKRGITLNILPKKYYGPTHGTKEFTTNVDIFHV